ncbi:MAG: hypothetical protein ACLFOY_06425 [Desulfatibacillaceae bacterium]
MGKFPVYQGPDLDEAERRMRPCEDYPHCFLGEDDRKLIQILDDDRGRVHALGLTHEDIADRLEELTEAGKQGLGEPVVVDDRYEVRVDAARGKIPCPFGHPGLYRKTQVRLRRLDTGETLLWTDLALHMVREHGFYQGRDSRYRINPEDARRILDL